MSSIFEDSELTPEVANEYGVPALQAFKRDFHFPRDARIAFDKFIHDRNYVNRSRLDPQKRDSICLFLNNPTLQPQNAAESNVKFRARTAFELIDNKLFRKSDIPTGASRYVVLEHEVFDLITDEHLELRYTDRKELSHVGQDRIHKVINSKYYGINRKEIAFVLKLCRDCPSKR